MAVNNPLDKSMSISGERALSRAQKIALAFLIIFSALILVFWLWQLQNRIFGPFAINSDSKNASSSQEELLNNLLKATDTDKDDLSDYDELYTYNTSPYLEDSDSDGLLDFQEINSGTDPNCPQGKDCTAPEIIIDNQASPSELTLPTTTTLTDSSVTTAVDASKITPAVVESLLQGKADIATLRQFYLESGMSENDLNKFSDAELMQMYRDVLESQSNNSNTSF